MVQVVKSQPTLAEVLGRTLGEQAGRATQGLGVASQEYAKQQKAVKEAEEMANYYDSIGLDRSLAYKPKDAQKDALKEFRRKKGWAETIGNYIGGNAPGPGGQFSGGVRQGAEGGEFGGNVLTREQAEELRAQGYDVPLPNAPTTIGQRLGSFATGVGTGLGGLTGDLLSLPQTGINAVARGLGYEDGAVPEYASGVSTMANEPGTQEEIQGLADKFGVAVDDPEFLKLLGSGELSLGGWRSANPLPPTTAELRKGLKWAVKDTPVEKLLVPQTSTQKWYEDAGQVMSWLANPEQAYAEAGIKGLAKNIAKTAGVVGAGDLAGWLTKNATGSELAGDLIKNGAYLAYGLWPGTMKQVATKEYDLYKKNVIDKAAQQGKKVNMWRYSRDIKDIERKIHKLVPGSEAHDWLANEWNTNFGYLKQRVAQDPEALWGYIKEQKGKFVNAPDQAKSIYKEMIGVSEKALENLGKSVNPGAVHHLADANRLWRTQSQLGEQASQVAKSIKGSLGLGLYMFLGGGYKALLATGATGFGAKYMSQMISDPTMQKYLTQLAKASASGNAAMINQLAVKMDQRARKINPAAARMVQGIMQKQGSA